ncbi:hypothetical protein EXIGLDRAFT_726306 [Exidia glandulosa HHB12029]|uniref:Uncharacterized protein n=1 Tax=Exidia glandulosa HHB12029 TaxID=1314781 RepID=A0A165DSV6_EXIGL|nr:hypothetical protein EXIGLDRAFT_726306 [Exidia glandulosa HHB12029]
MDSRPHVLENRGMVGALLSSHHGAPGISHQYTRRVASEVGAVSSFTSHCRSSYVKCLVTQTLGGYLPNPWAPLCSLELPNACRTATPRLATCSSAILSLPNVGTDQVQGCCGINQCSESPRHCPSSDMTLGSQICEMRPTAVSYAPEILWNQGGRTMMIFGVYNL